MPSESDVSIFNSIKQEIENNPPPCFIPEDLIDEIFSVLKKNQFRVNRDRSREKLNQLIEIIIEVE